MNENRISIRARDNSCAEATDAARLTGKLRWDSRGTAEVVFDWMMIADNVFEDGMEVVVLPVKRDADGKPQAAFDELVKGVDRSRHSSTDSLEN